MTITSVTSATFIADTIILLRDKLLSNITDPLVATRNTNEKFVLTEYPRRAVTYPIITITDTGTRQESRLGMQSEATKLRVGVEIRIWARNVKERDELFDSIYDYLRQQQFGTSSLTDANLHDFGMGSVVNVSEENIKSKVMEVNFLYLCTW